MPPPPPLAPRPVITSCRWCSYIWHARWRWARWEGFPRCASIWWGAGSSSRCEIRCFVKSYGRTSPFSTACAQETCFSEWVRMCVRWSRRSRPRYRSLSPTPCFFSAASSCASSRPGGSRWWPTPRCCPSCTSRKRTPGGPERSTDKSSSTTLMPWLERKRQSPTCVLSEHSRRSLARRQRWRHSYKQRWRRESETRCSVRWLPASTTTSTWAPAFSSCGTEAPSQ
mmetsp:Transcript_16916/g.55105  ORF Transcript_16916/g.55105 Transcript_16916/m.55105 type:complete len:226 (-) Transcript_16916:872-1549(-)